MPRLQDLTGMKFGKWTVISTHVKDNCTYCQCICECGKQHRVRANHLKSGASRSCHSCGNTRHGDSRSPLYDV